MHVFLLGIMPRSGTNFLFNLLQNHQDVELIKLENNKLMKGEDYFIYNSDTLLKSIKDISNTTYKWNIKKSFLKEKFLYPMYLTNSFTISKTPFFKELSNIKEFDINRFILAIRDGYSSTESYTKSFGSKLIDGIRVWNIGAEELSKFLKTKEIDNFLLVKYEDLVNDQKNTLKKTFKYLKLDSSKYSFEKAKNQGVIDSSQIKEKKRKYDMEQGIQKGGIVIYRKSKKMVENRYCYI